MGEIDGGYRQSTRRWHQPRSARSRRHRRRARVLRPALSLRGRGENSAFIDLGDQFLALQAGRKQPADDGRHFGLVVDDKEAVRAALQEAGIEPLPGPFLDFLDPWGNRIEIIGYENIQFTKAPNVLRGMGLSSLNKTEKAKKELADKGM